MKNMLGTTKLAIQQKYSRLVKSNPERKGFQICNNRTADRESNTRGVLAHSPRSTLQD